MGDIWSKLHKQQGSRLESFYCIKAEYVALSEESKAEWRNMVKDYRAKDGIVKAQNLKSAQKELHPMITDALTQWTKSDKCEYDRIWSRLHKQQGSRLGTIDAICAEYYALSKASRKEWMTMVKERRAKNSAAAKQRRNMHKSRRQSIS